METKIPDLSAEKIRAKLRQVIDNSVEMEEQINACLDS